MWIIYILEGEPFMKKPETMWKLCGTLFLILGAVFLLSGILSQMGILHTDPASRGDPKLWFPALGSILFGVGDYPVCSFILERKSIQITFT